MAYEPKPNSWSLFKNARKEKDNPAHEKWADYDGSAKVMLEGPCPHCRGHVTLQDDMFVNGWLRVGRDGVSKFFSGTFKAKQKTNTANEPEGSVQNRRPAPIPAQSSFDAGHKAAPRATLAQDIDDIIPF